MNASLREVHRWVWPALALGLPVLVSAAVFTRDPVPPMDALPAPFTPLAAAGGAPSVTAAIEGLDVSVAAWPDQVELTVRSPVRAPDVGVYVASTPPSDGLPSGASFLGMLSHDAVQRFPRPPSGDELVLYSLSDARVVGATSLGSR